MRTALPGMGQCRTQCTVIEAGELISRRCSGFALQRHRKHACGTSHFRSNTFSRSQRSRSSQALPERRLVHCVWLSCSSHACTRARQSDSTGQGAAPQQQVFRPQRRRPGSLQTCRTAVGHVGGSEEAASSTGVADVASLGWLHAFFKFSRPHTMLGTFVSIVSVSLLALGPQDFGWRSLIGLLQALVPALLMNIHIVGLNQIFDVEIDKVNKPYLPLASGEFTMNTAVTIVSICGALAVALGIWIGSPPLLATLCGSAVLGVAYSVDLPLLRWKQNPVASAACILAVRAVMVQLGFYWHMQRVMGTPALVLTRPLLFTIGFMLFFSIVIALFKDIPDVKGDRQEGVRTLSVRQGTRNVFWTCICLLEMAYTGAIVAGLASRVLWSRVATVAAHAVMAGLLYQRARQTDLDQSKSIYSCYMFVWKLFYAEYLLIPLLR